MIIILLGDPDNGEIQYIGTFDDPISASNYAMKHFKKMKWQLAVMSVKQD